MICDCGYDACSHESNGPRLPVKENRSEFVFLNPNRNCVHRVKVDGCYIKGHQPRCDYIIHSENSDNEEEVLYIELKGRNLERAYTQLKETIQHCAHKHQNSTKLAWIVASRCPKSSPATQRARLKFRKETGVTLNWATLRAEYTSKI
jgi:hypothetical protein